jgi:hypothetical protein
MSIYIEFLDSTGLANSRGYSLEFTADGRLYDFATDSLSASPTTAMSPPSPDARAIAEGASPFLGRYKAILPTTLAAGLPDGGYLVRWHDRAAGTVLDEAVTTLAGGVEIGGGGGGGGISGPVILAPDGLDLIEVEPGINARQSLALIGAERVGGWSYPDLANVGHVRWTAMGGSEVRVDATFAGNGRTTILTPPP